MDKKREYRVTIELLGEVAEYRPGGSRLEDLGWLESGEPAKVSAFRGHSYNPVSYTHLTLPTTTHGCRSRWSPYH